MANFGWSGTNNTVYDPGGYLSNNPPQGTYGNSSPVMNTPTNQSPSPDYQNQLEAIANWQKTWDEQTQAGTMKYYDELARIAKEGRQGKIADYQTQLGRNTTKKGWTMQDYANQLAQLASNRGFTTKGFNLGNEARAANYGLSNKVRGFNLANALDSLASSYEARGLSSPSGLQNTDVSKQKQATQYEQTGADQTFKFSNASAKNEYEQAMANFNAQGVNINKAQQEANIQYGWNEEDINKAINDLKTNIGDSDYMHLWEDWFRQNKYDYGNAQEGQQTNFEDIMNALLGGLGV